MFADYTARAMADTTIPDNALMSFLDALDKANVRVAEQFPGDSAARQPVHTVYGGAHLFKADAARKLGAIALRSLRGARARPENARGRDRRVRAAGGTHLSRASSTS